MRVGCGFVMCSGWFLDVFGMFSGRLVCVCVLRASWVWLWDDFGCGVPLALFRFVGGSFLDV